MKRFLPIGLCILGLCAALLWMPAHAQQASDTGGTTESTEESLSLTVGDVLEILPVHDVKGATYAWILTQDRTFMQAERTSSFRTRLIQPGSYTLLVEIDGTEPPVTLRRTFHITVTGRDQNTNPLPNGSNGGNAQQLVDTEPPLLPDNRIILPPGTQILTLHPLSPDRKPLALDLNTNADGNGDGIPNNDLDDAGTFFQTNAGTLRLWFASPLTSRDIAVTTVGTEGNAIVQTFQVSSYSFAKQQGITISPASIVATNGTGGTVDFAVQFQDVVPANAPSPRSSTPSDRSSRLRTPARIRPQR